MPESHAMAPTSARATRPTLRCVVWMCLERRTRRQATRTALIVGTLLAVINHGGDMFSGHLAWQWVVPTLLTYLVPYGVAMSGIVQGKIAAGERVTS